MKSKLISESDVPLETTAADLKKRVVGSTLTTPKKGETRPKKTEIIVEKTEIVVEKEKKVENPFTGRMIKLNSPTAKMLIKKGIINKEGEKIADETDINKLAVVIDAIAMMKDGKFADSVSSVIDYLSLKDLAYLYMKIEQNIRDKTDNVEFEDVMNEYKSYSGLIESIKKLKT